MTAEPMSVNTATPSPWSTSTMASMTRVASVPKSPSGIPAASAMGGVTSRTMIMASSTAASANRWLWETTTMPTAT